MRPPEEDQPDRRLIWNELQMFWMDTDPSILLEDAARICAQSKYSLSEIEQIFWDEVRPAVRPNLKTVAGEWTGFEIGWLSQQILKANRYGRRLPIKYFDRESHVWWKKLCHEIERMREEQSR
jgi:hypothetical protein